MTATLTITNEEPPPRSPRGRQGIDWKAVDRELRKAKGKWGTLGPWRSTGAASSNARRIADDKTPLDASHYEVETRRVVFDDGAVGSLLWLRYVGV